MAKGDHHTAILYRRKRAELIRQFGGRCFFCGATSDLQFAHLTQTDCIGLGRGSYRRLLDVTRHVFDYELLCKECHDALDKRSIPIFLIRVYGAELLRLCDSVQMAAKER